jgi:hypothetical protein
MEQRRTRNGAEVARIASAGVLPPFFFADRVQERKEE